MSERTLAANSVLIPIADYLYQRGTSERWLDAKEFQDDRRAIRGWAVRSLLKGGVWGSGLDTLLLTIRRAQRDGGHERFPVERIEAAMARAGKALTFSDQEIDELLDSHYGKPRTFALLAMMYTGIDVRNEFHVDHVFAKSRFTPARLRAAGIAAERIDEYRSLVDGLANLQLLEGPINTSKQATMPGEWARSVLADDDALGLYLAGHDLHGLPDDLDTFVEFCAARRERMQRRLHQALGTHPTLRSSEPPAPVPALTIDKPAARDDMIPPQPSGSADRVSLLHELPAALVADLDEAIVGLVRSASDGLGPAMPAHILWGSKGPATRASHGQHPDYGRFAHVQHADLMQRVHELIATGRLGLSGDPRILTVVYAHVNDAPGSGASAREAAPPGPGQPPREKVTPGG